MSVVINGVKAELATAISFIANPKRSGKKAWTRYESYGSTTTIGEYLEMTDPKYAMADLRYDHDHGFLTFVMDDEDTTLLAEALDVLHAE